MSYASQFKNSLHPLVAGRQLSFLDFQVISLIGAGSSGSVYHVVDKITSRDFAMKIIPARSEGGEWALREYFALREVSAAPFTVVPRGFFSDDVNYYLLTDYFSMDRVLKKDAKDGMFLEGMKDHIYFAGVNFDTLSGRKSWRPFPQRTRSVPVPLIDHSDDPRVIKTYFVHNALEPERPGSFVRFRVRLARFFGKSVKVEPTLATSTPVTVSPPAVSEASIGGGNIHRRSKKPYFFEPVDEGEGQPSAVVTDGRSTLYPEPRLPSTMREEIPSRRKSVGIRRRVSAIVDDDEPPTVGFRKLGLARSGPAVWNLAAIVLSPVMEGEEDGETEEKRGIMRSGAASWDLSSLV